MSAGMIHASAVLRRRAKSEDLGADAEDDAFWTAAPRLYDFSKQQEQPPARLHDFSKQLEPALAAPPSSSPAVPRSMLCLHTLQSSGVGWGQRKRVTYVARHRARHARVLAPVFDRAAVETSAALQGDGESSGSNAKKTGPPEEEASVVKAEAEERDREERKRKRKAGTGRARGRHYTRRPKAEGSAGPEEKEVKAEKGSQEKIKLARTEKSRPEEKKVKAEESSQEKSNKVAKAEKNRPEKKEVKAEECVQAERKVTRTEKNRPDKEEAKAEECGQDERKVTRTGSRRKMATSQRRAITKREEETESKPAAKADPPRAMVDRWSATRYAASEAFLLDVMHDHGAHAGKPIPRGRLRAEARKNIGDTGLLDHLLRHVINKVAAGSSERFRRRHNADGAMEYWLEPAELADVRREAGVTDPYWVPPPGWKPGDPVSPDACALEVKRQVEELTTELTGVKRLYEQLSSNFMQVSKRMESAVDKVHNSWQEKCECVLKANGNLEKQVFSLEEKYENATRTNGKLELEVSSLKEKYDSVLEKNARLEEQMIALSTSFLSLKEDLLFLNAGEQRMLELEQADLCDKEVCEADKQEGNGGNALDDESLGAGNSSSGGANFSGKRKCSVRVCKPQGTFQWPDTRVSVLAHPSPQTPTADDADAVANLATMDELHEYMMAGGGLPPTPPSVTSANTASRRLLLLPSPASPVKAPSSTSPMGIPQTVQPCSGHGLQLRQTGTSSSSSTAAPCGATASLLEGKKTMLDAGTVQGVGVGTELALATPSY